MLKNKRNWGDINYHFGPFTWSPSQYISYALMLRSGEFEYPGCNLRIQFRHQTLIIELPPIIKPWKHWVDTSHYNWDWTTSKGYWQEDEREYGISITDKTLHLRYGPQTNDSETEKNKVYFIPWLNHRFIRTSLYDINGDHFWTEFDASRPKCINKFQKYRDAKIKCPTKTFKFYDYDGELITVDTQIEEREWRLGTGWFKWLSYFTKPIISRSLDLEFSKEIGPKKGSWKGGTTGHSIELLPGELHESAFKRYCLENNLTFIEDITTPT